MSVFVSYSDNNKYHLIFLLLCVNIFLAYYCITSAVAASVYAIDSTSNSINSKSSSFAKKLSSINAKCLLNSECWVGSDHNRVCVDNRCQCAPNYEFDYINNKCKYFTCRLDKDCQAYDARRFCDAYDNCKCENGYGQHHVTQKCVPLRMIGSPCLEHSDCWTLTDSHRVCRDNACQCKLFYKYNYYEHKCVAKTMCDRDKDCKKYDPNRVCDLYGLCVCKAGFFANTINDKCKKIAATYSDNQFSIIN